MLQTLLRTRAGAIDMNIGRRTYPWPSARGPPLVRARTGPSSSGHGPELFLRRAVGQVGLGGVVPPGGAAVRIDVLPVMLNGPARERQPRGARRPRRRDAPQKLQPASRTHRELAALIALSPKRQIFDALGETRWRNVLGYCDGSESRSTIFTRCASQSSVGQTGIERHPMALPIVA